ncbi:DUF488 domain-containing protein [Ancylobacter sp. 6x-1]|uniref:DUF488 domain-containing protein n=1 Tax=Ancylobacter crimeensis TaxID=2579147 RepID=A0ABT0DFR1_9HYPH|nr:DUF488 domain-containing protein [Ancylobacter crimeensis]MCK0198806.1 DUF488 domain-containing protein [Ancylobacter crimeensis]
MKTPSRAAQLFTIGYEQVSSQAVLDTLSKAGVDLLVDVRAVAASRRPGFSKTLLAAGVQSREIGYLHLRGLGTPAEGRQAARSGRHADMRRIFEEHLATPTAQEQLAELTELVKSGRKACLLCFERHPEHCHRQIIADIVCERVGVPVEHLLANPL